MSGGEAREISAVTRRDILDHVAVEGIDWSGRLDEPSFLKRIWDLDGMPSTDHRFSTAEGDIYQHRVRNWDGERDWVFSDPRFDLHGCEDGVFARFLAEMLHPVVRPEQHEVAPLLAFFNECLGRDGWELTEVSQLSGKPVLAGRRRGSYKTPTSALQLEQYPRLDDPTVLRQQLQRIERDITADPPGAIAQAKELVESVCKLILDDRAVPYGRKDDLAGLYKKVQDTIGLNADAVPGDRRGSEAAVRTLRALVTTIQSLAELRNQLGLGHGPATPRPALTRHARLAFNAAVTVAEFLLDTWHAHEGATGTN